LSLYEAIRKADVLIVGAGFTGATYAQLLHSSGYNVVVIDKRNHVAGNAYTERKDNIDVHEYGAHIFHTPNPKIWEYVNCFGEFNGYRHHVLAISGGKTYTLPFTLKTLSEIYGMTMSPAQAKSMLEYDTMAHTSQNNLEEKALSLVGLRVYEKLIRDYTRKQWGVDPKNLPASVIARLPFRWNYDTRYFNDKYEGIPIDGYTKIVESMLEDVPTFLGVNWFDIRSFPDLPFVIYTGPVDQYFDYKAGSLTWRSVEFENKYLEGVKDHQGIAVMNYCDLNTDYTRIIEHKHFNVLDGSDQGTWISYERSCKPGGKIDPYYPVNQLEDKIIMSEYDRMKQEVSNRVHICGRLGDYAYYDMHQAIGIVFKDITEVERKIQIQKAN
jgi:UDP-galactopyranose mutase